MIGLTKVQWTDHPHAVGTGAEGHAENAQRHVNHAEDQRESPWR